MTDQGLEGPKTESQICPTCGTRNTGETARCVVCGTELRSQDSPVSPNRGRQVTLSLPVALIILIVFSAISVGATYALTRNSAGEIQATSTPTLMATATETATPEPSLTPTLEPTFTPLPPIEYTIAEGDSCVALAFFYNISVRSIIELNNLGVDCLLSIGTTILIPQPTPTPTPLPSATLSPAEATDDACEKINYTVEAGDSLSDIAENYQVSMQAIKEYNGMGSDTVFEGQILIVPLCERINFGPTSTPTPPPPYPAPNLLLPQNGASYSLADDSVSLQWASVAQLGDDEYYQVTIEDLTEGSGRRRIEEIVSDTKFIVPSSFRPGETLPHAMQWWVTTVRLEGTTASGEPRYVSAGATSTRRIFIWSGSAPQGTPAP